MKVGIKNLHDVQIDQDYNKHVKRIATILSEKRKPSNQMHAVLNDMHKRRLHSFMFCSKEKSTKINSENTLLLAKLFNISQRKSSFQQQNSFSNRGNPYRQKYTLNYRVQKQIQKQNKEIAERLVHKRSEFSHQKLKKQVNQYQKLRHCMIKNRQKTRRHHRQLKLPPVFQISKDNSMLQSLQQQSVKTVVLSQKPE